MSCYEFKKEHLSNNPVIKEKKNEPGKFHFPTATELGQASQFHLVGCSTTPGPTFSFSQPQSIQQPQSLFSFSQPQSIQQPQAKSLFASQQPQAKSLFASQQPQPQNIFPSQQPQSLFPSQQPQSLFPSQQPQNIFPSQQPQSLFPSQQPQNIFPSQQPQAKSLFPSQQPQAKSLFPSQQPQAKSLFPSEQSQNTYQLFPQTSNSSSIFNNATETPLRIVKYTTKVSTEKMLAILTSESYVNDENINYLSQLSLTCDKEDVTKVAPLALLTLEDSSATPTTQLAKLHIKFLKELIQETIKSEEDVWNSTIRLATMYGMQTMVQLINMTRPINALTFPEQHITPEISFVLALHAFATNNDNPQNVMSASKRYSKGTAKLAADMCMASYGLGWILNADDKSKYISKHKDTYTITW
jgi:hypothetical protein